MTVWVGGDVVEAGPGVCVQLPRNIPHTYRTAAGASTRWLVISSPAGFETLVERMQDQPVGRLFVDHGIGVLGPPGTTP